MNLFILQWLSNSPIHSVPYKFECTLFCLFFLGVAAFCLKNYGRGGGKPHSPAFFTLRGFGDQHRDRVKLVVCAFVRVGRLKARDQASRVWRGSKAATWGWWLKKDRKCWLGHRVVYSRTCRAVGRSAWQRCKFIQAGGGARRERTAQERVFSTQSIYHMGRDRSGQGPTQTQHSAERYARILYSESKLFISKITFHMFGCQSQHKAENWSKPVITLPWHGALSYQSSLHLSAPD